MVLGLLLGAVIALVCIVAIDTLRDTWLWTRFRWWLRRHIRIRDVPTPEDTAAAIERIAQERNDRRLEERRAHRRRSGDGGA